MMFKYIYCKSKYASKIEWYVEEMNTKINEQNEKIYISIKMKSELQ